MLSSSVDVVNPSWVKENKNDNIVIVDCWRKAAYKRIHIKDAVCLPVDYWLKEKNKDGIARGIHVMSKESIEDVMGSIGVDNDTTVVAYDENNGKASARVWWVLKYYGHDDTKILDGGWHRWFNEKGDISNREPDIESKSFSAKERPGMIAKKAEVFQAVSGNTQIVDARSHQEWTGDDPHGNPRAGRIPSAINLEWSRFVTPDSNHHFIDLDDMKKIEKEHELNKGEPVITYCQSGIRAAHLAFTLSTLGYNVKVYDGSIAEWSRDKNTPMEKGLTS